MSQSARVPTSSPSKPSGTTSLARRGSTGSILTTTSPSTSKSPSPSTSPGLKSKNNNNNKSDSTTSTPIIKPELRQGINFSSENGDNLNSDDRYIEAVLSGNGSSATKDPSFASASASNSPGPNLTKSNNLTAYNSLVVQASSSSLLNASTSSALNQAHRGSVSFQQQPNMSLIDPLSGDRVVVAVRVRPLSSKEMDRGDKQIVSMSSRKRVVYVEGEEQMFPCDHTLWSSHNNEVPDRDGLKSFDQEDVFNSIGRPLLENALEGYNACVLCYGQTGSGKTYTMSNSEAFDEIDLSTASPSQQQLTTSSMPASAGLLPRMCTELFSRIQDIHKDSQGEIQWTVSISYVEVYLEKVTDLLKGMKTATSHVPDTAYHHPASALSGGGGNSQYASVREDGEGRFIVIGANKMPVSNLAEVLNVMKYGNRLRRTAATNMNEHSSRSHALFFIHLTETLTIQMPNTGETASAHSKSVTIKMVDLAGSERVNESGVTGERFKESVAINKSLLQLRIVIDHLTDPKYKNSVTPYRDSILTKLLKDTFGGNSKTVMIATVGPSEQYRTQTIHTLNYATRARRVTNMAIVMEDPQAAELRRKQEELDRVRKELEAAHQMLQQGVGNDEKTKELEAELDEAQRKIREDQERARQRDEIIARKQRELEAMLANNQSLEEKWQNQIASLEQAKKQTQQELIDTEKSLKEAQTNAKKAAEVLKHKEEELERQLKEIDAKAAARLKELEEATKSREDALQQMAEEAEARAKKREESLRAKAEEAEQAALEREKELAEKVALAEKEAAEKLEELATKAKQMEEDAKKREEELEKRAAAIEAAARAREAELAKKAEESAAESKRKEEELEEKANQARLQAAAREEELKQQVLEAERRAAEHEKEMKAKAEQAFKDQQLALELRLSELEIESQRKLADLQKNMKEREERMLSEAKFAEEKARRREMELAEKASAAEREAKAKEAQLAERIAAAGVLEMEAKKREQDLLRKAHVLEDEAKLRERELAEKTRQLQDAARQREATFAEDEKRIRAKMQQEQADYEKRLKMFEDEAKKTQSKLDQQMRDLAAREADFKKKLEEANNEKARREAELEGNMAKLNDRRVRGVGNAVALTEDLLEKNEKLRAMNEKLWRGVKNCPRCTVEVPVASYRCEICGNSDFEKEKDL